MGSLFLLGVLFVAFVTHCAFHPRVHLIDANGVVRVEYSVHNANPLMNFPDHAIQSRGAMRGLVIVRDEQGQIEKQVVFTRGRILESRDRPPWRSPTIWQRISGLRPEVLELTLDLETWESPKRDAERR